LLQCSHRPSVANDVAGEFLAPERSTSLGLIGTTAIVTVPKASMNENGRLATSKHKVGRPWKVTLMKPKPVTHSMR
jgi:hypothetical protein